MLFLDKECAHPKKTLYRERIDGVNQVLIISKVLNIKKYNFCYIRRIRAVVLSEYQSVITAIDLSSHLYQRTLSKLGQLFRLKIKFFDDTYVFY